MLLLWDWSAEDDVPQHNGMVVDAIPGPIDEGDRSLIGPAAEIVQRF